MKNQKIEFDNFVSSQSAIKKYMRFKDINGYVHQARVLISCKGKTIYNGLATVVPSIQTNHSFIDIMGDVEFERDFYAKYTNEYQKFECINRTLFIKAKDRWGNNIEINISAI